jgi:hypothetical protein
VSTYPGAPEICGDGKDNNCDGSVDEAGCICPDADGDTYELAVCAAGPGDCNDADPTVNPAAMEICDDGIDNNCDGFPDCQDAACTEICGCVDADNDNYNVNGNINGFDCGPVDCDDNDPTINPGAKDVCDGKDNNCDGYVKPNDVDNDGDGQPVCGGDCNDNDITVYKGAPEICDGLDNDCRSGIPADERDFDGDSFRICTVPGGPASDCNDYDPGTNPGALEICGDGKDNNCNDAVDEPGCVCPDADGDGFPLALCEADPARADCNDADNTIYPGAQEVCDDGIDNNCNARVDCADTGCALDDGCRACIASDGDGDGYSTLGGICGPIDCNDGDPAINPGAAEICDGKDNNCDGVLQSPTDVDNDGDTYPVCAGDCNDNDATIYPGAPEGCNGIDNDCVSGVPAIERDFDGDGVRLCDVPPDCDDYDANTFPAHNGNPAATEICADGKDNDCDGTVDEADCEVGCVPTGPDNNCNGVDEDCIGGPDDGYVPIPTTCGVGACTGNTGQLTCVAGSEVDSCDPFGGAAADDPTCDDVDDDCDGAVDEDYVNTPTACGLGVCAATGQMECQAGGVEINTCVEGPPSGISETICNGDDDDCDGAVDEDYVDSPTTCGVGACAGNTGQLTCDAGSEVDSCDPFGGAVPEICDDGIDNDCDDLTDSADTVDCPVNCSTYTDKNSCDADPNCKWRSQECQPR